MDRWEIEAEQGQMMQKGEKEGMRRAKKERKKEREHGNDNDFIPKKNVEEKEK